jgi:hypothetical protein
VGLGAGEGTCGGEHPPIDTPPVIQEVADGDLEDFLLGQGGWRGRVGGRTLRGRRAKVRRGVDGGGRRWLNAEGSEAAQERGDVAGVGER